MNGHPMDRVTLEMQRLLDKYADYKACSPITATDIKQGWAFFEQSIADKTYIENKFGEIRQQQEKTMKHPHADLILMYANQLANGERDYWTWTDSDQMLWLGCPKWDVGVTYECRPSPKHPNYAVYKEWEAHKESGAVERGEIEIKADCSELWLPFTKHSPISPTHFSINSRYTIIKTDKHPDNQKKVLDWTQEGLRGCYVKMEKDGADCQFIGLAHNSILFFWNEKGFWLSKTLCGAIEIIKPLENKGWQVYMEGVTKVPEGVEIEFGYDRVWFIGRAAGDLEFLDKKARYRVTGIADGWRYPEV